MPEQSTVPAGRYGPVPDERSRRRTVVAIWAAGIVGLGLAVWLGLIAATDPVTWKDVGFTVEGADRTEIVFDVIRTDPSTPVRCRVEALDTTYAQVGVRTVDVAPGDRQAQRERAVIATSGLPTTAVVSTCWVVEE